ncbi:aryl-sulfate sulfotransferase, partial [Halobium palmae]
AIGTEGVGDGDRRTLVGSQGGGAGLHDHGSVYLLDGNRTVWSESTADSYFDVTMLENGTVAAGFMHGGYRECGPYDAPCARTGFRIIDPGPDPTVVSEFSFPVRTRGNSEVHDVEPLPEGGYVVTDMDYERIVVVRNGSIEWQWNASSVYDAPADPTREDWLHINDVDYLGDDRFLVSVRNANQLLVVERGEGSEGGEVVEVVNAVDDESDEDGVGIASKELLNSQHNPQWLDPGAVLVADSHNNRIVELHRNNETGEWEEAWTLSSAEGTAFRWPRDADRLENGNTLVTDSLNGRIVEVNESGAAVWSYKAQYVPYEADRLPEGEQPSGERYAAGDAVGPSSVPVLTSLLNAVRASYPLPYWIAELQLALAIVSLGMVFGGVGTVVWSRVRGRSR